MTDSPRSSPLGSSDSKPVWPLLVLAAPLLACAAARPLPQKAAAGQQSLLATADRVQGQVVGVSGHSQVVVDLGEGRLEVHLLYASGSGVLLPHGIVATSLHLVVLPEPGGRLELVDDVSVLRSNAPEGPAHVLRIFPALDLALLQLDGVGDDEPGAELADHDAKQADRMLAVSAKGGRLALVAVGCRGVEPEGEDPGLIELDDLGLGSRFLGGPLFGADGKVAGLLVAGPAGTGGALPAAVIRKALQVDDMHASADGI
jgi:hypothetical protein